MTEKIKAVTSLIRSSEENSMKTVIVDAKILDDLCDALDLAVDALARNEIAKDAFIKWQDAHCMQVIDENSTKTIKQIADKLGE